MIPTPEDGIRMRDESLPDHINFSDNGKGVFVKCDRCGLYIKVWADGHTRRCASNDFIKEHTDCPGLPVYDEDEIKHVPPLSGEERCPRMGMQGAVLKSARRI